MSDLHAKAADALAASALNTRHGQLCPVYTRRAKDEPITSCNCWVLRNAQRDAAVVLGVVQPELDRAAAVEAQAVDYVDDLNAQITEATKHAEEAERDRHRWRSRAEQAEAELERHRAAVRRVRGLITCDPMEVVHDHVCTDTVLVTDVLAALGLAVLVAQPAALEQPLPVPNDGQVGGEAQDGAVGRTELRERICAAIGTTMVLRTSADEIAAAVLEVVQPELDLLLGMLERMPDTHMQFGLIHLDGTREELPCADWCWARRVEQAEAAVERARALLEPYPAGAVFGILRGAMGEEWAQGVLPADDLRAALGQPASAVLRCTSCDHLISIHQPEGCWFTVTTGAPDHDLVCPCSVSSEDFRQPAKEGTDV